MRKEATVVKENVCRYKDLGCDGKNGHKTARCQLCLFHSHYKDDTGKVRKLALLDELIKQLSNVEK